MNMCPAICLLALATSVMASTDAPRNGPANPTTAKASKASPSVRPTLTPELREQITDLVVHAAKWKAGDLRLAWADPWDHALVPVVMAHPTINLPYSVPVALLDQRRLTPYDKDALETIVRARLRKPRADQAEAIAKLALWFGDFGVAVGELAATIPVSLRERLRSPPRDTAPRLSSKSNGFEVRFYSVDHELGRVYECRTKTHAGRVELTARLLD